MAVQEYNNTYKPFIYPWAVEMTRRHEEIHWTEDEAEVSEDLKDWKSKLTDQERELITHILRLFTQGDVQVGQNYHNFLIPQVKNNELRVMLSSFAGREGTHQRAYALLNDTLGLDESEYTKFLSYKEMADKIDFMQSAKMGNTQDLILALAQSVMNEGVSLFSSFVMLLNFQRFGKMKSMGTVVEWSIRDESMHVEGNSGIFHELVKENPHLVTDELKAKIYGMAERVDELEAHFVDLAYDQGKITIEGLTREDVKLYIRYLLDRRLIQLGLKPIFRVKKNPIPWLDWIIGGVSHDNFFEKRVTEYSVNGMQGDWGWI